MKGKLRYPLLISFQAVSHPPSVPTVAVLGNPPTTADTGISSGNGDALTALAQQLHCQMRSGSTDPTLQKALAGLKQPSNFATPSNLPTGTQPSDVARLPTGNLPGDRFDIDAITRLAQALQGQIPPISAASSPIGSIK